MIIPCLYNKVQVKEAIFKTLKSNGMFDNAHIRLTLTRGKKVISSITLSGYYHLKDDTLVGLDAGY